MGGNLLMSVLPNNFGCPPILTTYEGQVGLRANKGLNWSNHFIYSPELLFFSIQSYEYSTIHHTLGIKYTRYHTLNVRYGGDFYNLLYLIVHSHKVHIYLLNFTSKTFEQLIGCQVQNLYLHISYIHKVLSTL